MKKLTLPVLLLIATFFSGCVDNRANDGTILSKEFLSDGICNFTYSFKNSMTNELMFQDSCNKFSVGDTLTFKKK